MQTDFGAIDFTLWLLVLSTICGLAWLTDVLRQRSTICGEYGRSFFPVLFAVLLLRSFLLEPFRIPSPSMVPTLKVGDFIVVNKFAYGLRLPVTGTRLLSISEPKRGDVVVFIPPHTSSHYIKRVAGLPGDHLRYAAGTLYINGSAVTRELIGMAGDQRSQLWSETLGGVTHDTYSDTWADPGRSWSWLPPEGVVVPDGHYFMLGDNRDRSEDSRAWGFVPERNLVGKAVAVWMQKQEGWQVPSFSGNRLIANAP